MNYDALVCAIKHAPRCWYRRGGSVRGTPSGRFPQEIGAPLVLDPTKFRFREAGPVPFWLQGGGGDGGMMAVIGGATEIARFPVLELNPRTPLGGRFPEDPISPPYGDS